MIALLNSTNSTRKSARGQTTKKEKNIDIGKNLPNQIHPRASKLIALLNSTGKSSGEISSTTDKGAITTNASNYKQRRRKSNKKETKNNQKSNKKETNNNSKSNKKKKQTTNKMQ